MNGHEKTDGLVVPAKLPNKTGVPVAEAVEGSSPAEGSTDSTTRPGRSAGQGVSSGLDRVREVAQKDKDVRFTALLHHVDLSRLWAAYVAINPKASPGVDKVTWETYGQDLRANLEDLRKRVHSGAYRASPSRRVYIPKPDGRLRPLGIATLEDKIVQRAVIEVLNAIYEEDFLGFSYGFRPGRGAHDAMDALVVGIERRKVNWILDADIRDFFGSVSQEWLIRFIEHRIGDKRMIRLVQKWLRAGILEDGSVTVSDRGTGQGSVVSPLLANIYLHYVLDLWVERWRRREATGDMIFVRYADDLVAGFEHEDDARRFLAALHERFGKFALSLHPDKTRLIEFGRHAAVERARRGLGKPETFNFLGFTFISGKARSGKFLVKRTSRRDRMQATLNEVTEELRRRMHQPIPEQGKWLQRIVVGYFNYHAVPTNWQALVTFRDQIVDRWQRTLRRRSQKGGKTWDRMAKLADDFLPKPRIIHLWPWKRFIVKHPRWEPDARKMHVRICAGGAW